jgi:hypothetical protein
MATARKRSGAKAGRKARSGTAKSARGAVRAARAKSAKPKVAAKRPIKPQRIQAKPAKAKPAKVKPAKVAPAKVVARRAPPAAVRPRPVDAGAAKRQEYAALKARAAAIGMHLRVVDEAQSRAIEAGPWARLMADLDAWAAKYNVKTHEHTVAGSDDPPPSGATPRFHSAGNCPTEIIQRDPSGRFVTADCFFRRKTLFGHNCLYTCYIVGDTQA